MSVPYVSYLYPAGGSADDDPAFFIDFADAFLRLGDDGVDIVSYVGPVIGAHSGPGTLALFFEGKER